MKSPGTKEFVEFYRGYDIWRSTFGTYVVTVGQGDFYGLEVSYKASYVYAKDFIDQLHSPLKRAARANYGVVQRLSIRNNLKKRLHSTAK